MRYVFWRSCWRGGHTESVTEPTPHAQASHRIRFDWGPQGAQQVPADIAVVVDVLSFTTALTIAVERGIEVFPHPVYDTSAKELAFRHGAALAVRRFEALSLRDARHISLSPVSLMKATGVDRLVLPSPNGSRISADYAESGAAVIGACLRNAGAAASHIAERLGPRGTVVVIAAGEQWPDGSLRPAAEDLWGAGAVLTGLATALGDDLLSPEAHIAANAFTAVRPRLAEQMNACASGRELAERGFAQDVEIAAEYAVSPAVPHLVGASFIDAAAR